jgi:predicted ATPase
LEAVIAVIRGAGYPESAVQEGIANLVAKSFVILNRSPSGGRWALPETIRAYALEKLVESGEVCGRTPRPPLHGRQFRAPSGCEQSNAIRGP